MLGVDTNQARKARQGVASRGRRKRRRKQHQITVRRMMSLVGKLRWASVAFFTGQAFVRALERLIYKKNFPMRLGRRLYLSVASKKDLSWWTEAIESRREGFELGFILDREPRGDLVLYTDASLTIGLGFVTSVGTWYQAKWTDLEAKGWRLKVKDIFAMEMLAIALAVRSVATVLRHKNLTIFCDNMGCVESLAAKRCTLDRDDVMDLIRAICLDAIKFKFYFWITHVKTDDNNKADALSRYADGALHVAQEGFDHEPFEEEMVDCDAVLEEWLGGRGVGA